MCPYLKIMAPCRTPSSMDERVMLWRGDIATLAVDAIVNAANSQMLGCWVPGHRCIDSAIHTYSGVQLRAECARLMEEQGAEEPTGMAKITPVYTPHALRLYVLASWLLADTLVEDWFVEAEHALAAHLH